MKERQITPMRLFCTCQMEKCLGVVVELWETGIRTPVGEGKFGTHFGGHFGNTYED